MAPDGEGEGVYIIQTLHHLVDGGADFRAVMPKGDGTSSGRHGQVAIAVDIDLYATFGLRDGNGDFIMPATSP